MKKIIFTLLFGLFACSSGNSNDTQPTIKILDKSFDNYDSSSGGSTSDETSETETGNGGAQETSSSSSMGKGGASNTSSNTSSKVTGVGGGSNKSSGAGGSSTSSKTVSVGGNKSSAVGGSSNKNTSGGSGNSNSGISIAGMSGHGGVSGASGISECEALTKSGENYLSERETIFELSVYCNNGTKESTEFITLKPAAVDERYISVSVGFDLDNDNKTENFWFGFRALNYNGTEYYMRVSIPRYSIHAAAGTTQGNDGIFPLQDFSNADGTQTYGPYGFLHVNSDLYTYLDKRSVEYKNSFTIRRDDCLHFDGFFEFAVKGDKTDKAPMCDIVGYFVLNKVDFDKYKPVGEFGWSWTDKR